MISLSLLASAGLAAAAVSGCLFWNSAKKPDDSPAADSKNESSKSETSGVDPDRARRSPATTNSRWIFMAACVEPKAT